MLLTSFKSHRIVPWAAAALSAGLLELPFPLAGPLPVWRSVFAWFGLVPLLWAILAPALASELQASRPLRRGFLLGYLAGFLWYAGNCYWVRDTMARYGDLPAIVPVLLLIGYSLVLGLYFAFFGLAVALVRKATGSTRLALAAAPIFWAALELAAARITSVPWDQLGYSQVDNGLVNQLAPWTGVYGISFVLVAANAFLAGCVLTERKSAPRFARPAILGVLGVFLIVFLMNGVHVLPPRPAPTATAVLIQPNLDVSQENRWLAPGEWESHMDNFSQQATEPCSAASPSSTARKTYIAGIPQTGAPTAEILCPPNPTHPDLVVWPESPAPFDEIDPKLQRSLISIAHTAQAPLVVGSVGWDQDPETQAWRYYNSALVISPTGARVGRYDKIHLVPYGEYIPYKEVFFFARKLTGRVSEFTRGTDRKVFRLPTANGEAHRYGVFICYESVFADEVRQFAQLGAEVLVNISDDGWYGDTSAPWQHLNMVRMRAIENRRWILRDTNTGVTAVIDPEGRVRQSIARHQPGALPARFAFRDDLTYYTAHGDVFAWLCAILAIGIVFGALRVSLRIAIRK